MTQEERSKKVLYLLKHVVNWFSCKDEVTNDIRILFYMLSVHSLEDVKSIYIGQPEMLHIISCVSDYLCDTYQKSSSDFTFTVRHIVNNIRDYNDRTSPNLFNLRVW